MPTAVFYDQDEEIARKQEEQYARCDAHYVAAFEFISVDRGGVADLEELYERKLLDENPEGCGPFPHNKMGFIMWLKKKRLFRKCGFEKIDGRMRFMIHASGVAVGRTCCRCGTKKSNHAPDVKVLEMIKFQINPNQMILYKNTSQGLCLSCANALEMVLKQFFGVV